MQDTLINNVRGAPAHVYTDMPQHPVYPSEYGKP